MVFNAVAPLNKESAFLYLTIYLIRFWNLVFHSRKSCVSLKAPAMIRMKSLKKKKKVALAS